MKWWTVLLCGLCLGLGSRTTCGADSARNASCSEADYRGWVSQRLANEFLAVYVVPAIGGRVIQFQLGSKEFLWVNPKLAGQLPPASGLDPDGGWLNYGGDKLWPAPQGWDNDEQWPGPPDAVLDGQPYECEKIDAAAGEVGVRLTSGRDQRSGIQFSRIIRIATDCHVGTLGPRRPTGLGSWRVGPLRLPVGA